jgi:hypothetical protein
MNNTSTIPSLLELYAKGLEQLKIEIQSYTNERLLWETSNGIANCGGNLCLHLIGNLNHFIGATLGQTGYVRKREDEFSQRNVPLHQLIEMIAATNEMIQKVLPTIMDEDLEKTYPLEVFKRPMRTGFFLFHLVGHLNYHLGQLNYHRRMINSTQKD